MRSSLVFLGLSGLAVGFVFMYASLQKRDTTTATTATPVRQAPTSSSSVESSVVTSAPPPPPDESRSAQLFDRNRGMASDPDLAVEYEQLNLDYFKNILPKASVRWESGLEDLGPLIADKFSVLGLTDGAQILLNPVVQRDPEQRRRALCHEMVHMAVWAQDAGHGPVFQTQLRHLAEMGAFKGVVSTDDERDAALEALKRKRTALEAEERALEADHDTVDRSSQSSVDAFNDRIRRQRDAAAEYNHLIEQYNLMVSYPDGLARERLKPRGDGTLR